MSLTPTAARANLVEALRLDLVGPGNQHAFARELLPEAPSRWYLTGFLVPRNAPEDQRTDAEADESLDAGGDDDGDDAALPDRAAAGKSFLPSSLGLSFLVTPSLSRLDVTVAWGDYEFERRTGSAEQSAEGTPKDFAVGLIGFGRDIEKSLLEATSPFVFSAVNERTILRFLKLIACDNSKIGTYAKLVDDRNETAHPNGNIFFSTEAALDAKITETLRVVDEIQTRSRPVIEHCYRDFLLQSHDPEEREYPDAADQIREVLIHGNYLSQKDVDICVGFDLESLAHNPAIASIRELHDALVANYVVENMDLKARVA